MKVTFSKRLLCLSILYIAAFSTLLFGLKQLVLCSRQIASAENLIRQAKTAQAAQSTTKTDSIQQHIAQNIIRLHVIANSDSDKDQQLKLKVRDATIGFLQTSLKDTDQIDDARQIIKKQQNKISKTAKKVLTENGSNASVSVCLKARYFPVKQYGDLTFPAGTYQALCIEIGEAAGRNWWCVLFPSLCFVDETTATVPETSKEKLREELTQEEYDSLEKSVNQESADNLEESAAAENQTEKNSSESSSSENSSSENSSSENSSKNEKPEIRSALWDWFSGAEE
ncbi:MAG: stage II sporulation protein R [Clostridiaceae bacterium]|nr:stage II sporulation protein R [Clostridiaceae bacterium]